MILPTTLVLGALGYLFYTSKKELSLDQLDTKEKENDDLYKDLEDLFI
jgi:Tfp pilus assembly protein PilO